MSTDFYCAAAVAFCKLSRGALHFDVNDKDFALIKTFADEHTRQLFCDGVSKICPADLRARALRKLDMLDNAQCLADLKVPPENRLHALAGDWAGQHLISVNDRWRICFVFDGQDAYNVEFCDYH